LLRGKRKPEYTPSCDVGDFVVAINASGLKLTGNKLEQKNYYRYSLYPGGLKVTSAKDKLRLKPEEMLLEAVAGMLPKTALGKQMLKKLKVFRGADHEHAAQNPKPYDVAA
jgi:large subunit ribosomal protein L13